MSQPTSGSAAAAVPPVVVVSEDGQPAPMAAPSGPAEMVGQPAKVMRIGTMVKQLLEEVRAAPLDEAGRKRLKEIYEASIMELADALDPELTGELQRLALPFGETTPTEAELRIAQAQLVGWLEGLFHGIQMTLFQQQLAARAQLDQIRQAALPPGSAPPQGPPMGPEPSGPYL
ncbi:MAG: bacterial proteasome activator family protein [Pseudonocardiales bacterium]